MWGYYTWMEVQWCDISVPTQRQLADGKRGEESLKTRMLIGIVSMTTVYTTGHSHQGAWGFSSKELRWGQRGKG